MSEERVDQIPPVGVDLSRPSVARVYDYYLGGTANWAIDREFGDRVVEKVPQLKSIAIANRVFLNRVVRHLVRRGVRQFLDVGAGVPTVGSTHQVADELARETGHAPDAHVVYADHEPVAVAHAELLLDAEGDARRHAVIEADLREPERLWEKAFDTDLLDPSEPIALLLIAVLHVHQPGPDGTDIGAESVARLRDLLPGGSYLALSHLTADGLPPEVAEQPTEIKRMYDSSSSSNAMLRSRAEIQALLGDFDPVPPGWTWTPEWHPEEAGPHAPTITFAHPAHALVWAGVGHKPR